MPATYVSIVNDAIDESGVDLAQYEPDGSDFTTNTEAMLVHFKKWVARAWKTVQQTAFDWEFLNNQGIVTLNPGLMFYTTANLAGEWSTEIDVYGTDDALLFENLQISKYVDLTYTQYSDSADKSFGYVDLYATDDQPLSNISFKAGGDYFYLEDRNLLFTAGPQVPYFFDKGVFVGQTLSMVVTVDAGGLGEMRYSVPDGAILLSFDPDTNDSSKGSQGFTFNSTSTRIIEALNSAHWQVDFFLYASDVTDPQHPNGTNLVASVADFTTLTYETTSTKCFLHSWKSFNFEEETSENDYVGELSEIDNNSFQFIDRTNPSPASATPLTFVPWDVFSCRSDWLCSLPGTPAYITEDNTGRWRLYPQPDRPVTLKFSYSRVPQTLTNFDDTLKGLPSDFTDLVMWLAIRMYAEFDEQPSIQRRAERYYKDMLQRLQIKYRPKFRLAPKRLY